jgi:hypothetical protein
MDIFSIQSDHLSIQYTKLQLYFSNYIFGIYYIILN